MDDSEDRRLIEAWQDVDGAASTEDCPPAERIWEAARGRLTVEERLAVIDHVTQCPACVEAWRLARTIEGDLPRRAALPVAPVWQMWPGAVAAAAVVVLALSLFLVPSVPPIDRDPPAGRLEIVTPEDAVLSRDAFVLRWRPGRQGSRYHVVVTTENLESDRRRPSHRGDRDRVPSAKLSGLPQGARLRWRVMARTPDGGSAESTTSAVHLR